MAEFADDKPVFEQYYWRLADYEAGGVDELPGFNGERLASSPIGLPPRDLSGRSTAAADDDGGGSEFDDSGQSF